MLATHYRSRSRQKHHQNAEFIDSILGDNMLVRHHAESGDSLDSVYSASMQTAITEFAKPYARMYVMQIARFLGCLLSELAFEAYRAQLDTIPHLSEFYAIFNNQDKYFRQRKMWSIYKP